MRPSALGTVGQQPTTPQRSDFSTSQRDGGILSAQPGTSTPQLRSTPPTAANIRATPTAGTPAKAPVSLRAHRGQLDSAEKPSLESAVKTLTSALDHVTAVALSTFVGDLATPQPASTAGTGASMSSTSARTTQHPTTTDRSLTNSAETAAGAAVGAARGVTSRGLNVAANAAGTAMEAVQGVGAAASSAMRNALVSGGTGNIPARQPESVSAAVRQSDAGHDSWSQFLRREARRPEYDVEGCYLDLTLLYGFLTMFSFLYPATAFLVLLVHHCYGAMLLQFLLSCRRPRVPKRSTLGTWQRCWELLSFVSVLFNCTLLLRQGSGGYGTAVEARSNTAQLEDRSNAFRVLILAAGLLISKVALMFLIDRLPGYIRRELASQRAAQAQLAARQRLQRFTELQQGLSGGGVNSAVAAALALAAGQWSPQRDNGGDDANTANSSPDGREEASPARMGTTAMQLPSTVGRAVDSAVDAGMNAAHTRTGIYGAEERRRSDNTEHRAAMDIEAEQQCRAQEGARNSSLSRLLDDQVTQKFAFEPLSLTLLVALPPLLQWLHVPFWLYIPVALVYFSYLSAEKARNDRKIAIGIVTDPHLVKLGKHCLHFALTTRCDAGTLLFLLSCCQNIHAVRFTVLCRSVELHLFMLLSSELL
jgi:hypothetical protein